jgi:pyruvate dehydrogenase E1 component
LGRNGLDCERWNLLNPSAKAKVPYVTKMFEKTSGPIVASSDYMKLFADQIRPFMPKNREYRVLGTDGFGRSDFRAKLREHFEVDRYFVVVATLKVLADEGTIEAGLVAKAIKKYNINVDKVNPANA